MVCVCVCVYGNYEQLCVRTRRSSDADLIDIAFIVRCSIILCRGNVYCTSNIYLLFFLSTCIYRYSIGMTRALCRHRNNCPYRKFWMIPRGFRWHYYIIIIVGGKRGYNIIIFINNINYLLNVFFELFNSTKNLPIENKIWSYVSVSIFSPFI